MKIESGQGGKAERGKVQDAMEHTSEPTSVHASFSSHTTYTLENEEVPLISRHVELHVQ